MKTDSELLKIRIIDWLYYQRGFYAAFTEFYNHSDVFGIKRTFFTREIEIKISRSDLRSELKIIQNIQNNKREYKARYDNKYIKHDSYLHNNQKDKYGLDNFVPNEFSFLIPADLLEYAKSYLEETPYGIITYKLFGEDYFPIIEEEKRPDKIHRIKFDLVKHKGIWRKSAMENQILRKRLRNLT